ncbi:unnamed protein product [Cuscuta campestris]|uniref:Uncharacterized protein n=1 Tax=Cuscuta campestris TaxID=132261 RepID=A0A484L125_9ASTE|nr:unnamed protein product [Cuscuta campestris]
MFGKVIFSFRPNMPYVQRFLKVESKDESLILAESLLQSALHQIAFCIKTRSNRFNLQGIKFFMFQCLK